MTPNVRRALALSALTLILVPVASMAKRRPSAAPAAPGFLLQRVIDRLDLTADQVIEMRAIFSAHREELRTELDAIRTTRQGMFEAIHAQPADEAAIRAAAAKVGEAEANLAVTRATILAEVREVLTEEQQAEAQEMIADARERFEDLLAFLQDRLSANPLVG